MIGRKAVVGLCLVCAFAFAAVAQSASAAGTTAYTCATEGTAVGVTLAKGHCRPGEGTGSFRHVAIANGAPGKTAISGGNENTNAETTAATNSFFHVVITGIEAELKATTVTGSGFMENKEEGGEMLAHGTGKLTYENVTVVKPEGCSVEGGSVVTKELTAKTVEAPIKGLKFSPAAGTTFAEFQITGASCSELIQGTFKITGSLIGTPNGATVSTTRGGSTEQGTLKARNLKAGLDGVLTFKNSSNGTALSVT